MGCWLYLCIGAHDQYADMHVEVRVETGKRGRGGVGLCFYVPVALLCFSVFSESIGCMRRYA